jgi:hypothetical protein
MKNTEKRLSLAELKAKVKGMKSESLEKIKGGQMSACHVKPE